MTDSGVWFSDLEKALKVFRKKLPEVELFNSINGNIYGDFFITCSRDTYIVTHDTFKVYHNTFGSTEWIEIE